MESSKSIRQSLIFFLSTALISTLLCIHPLIASTYFSVIPNSIVNFGFCVILLTAVFAWMILGLSSADPEKVPMCAVLAGLTFHLQSASATALPLLKYTSGLEHAEAAAASDEYIKYIFLFLGSFLVAWGLIFVLRLLIRLRNKVASMLMMIANVIIMAVLLLFNDGFGTTVIHDVQVGLPLLAYLFLVTAYGYHAFLSGNPETEIILFGNRKLSALLFLASETALLMGYIGCSEFGIPIYFALVMVIWFYLYLPEKSVKTFSIVTAVVGGTGALVMGYYFLYYRSLAEEDRVIKDFHRLGSKIGRIFEQPEQTRNALERIRSGGFFGNMGYRYLPEATTDFSIALSTHYVGILWLMITIFLLGYLAFTGNQYFRKEEHRLQLIPQFGFLCILCLSTMNILGNLGKLGIIGVSCYSSGYGKTVYVLSGMLMGFVLYPSNANLGIRIGKSS